MTGIYMKKLLRSALIAAVAGVSVSASALEVTIDNQTSASGAFAFSYLDRATKVWMTDGWYNSEGGKVSRIDLPTDNPIYYIYAEFSNGKRIEGGEGAVALDISNRSFLCEQDKGPEVKNTYNVKFLRAQGNGSKAVIRVK